MRAFSRVAILFSATLLIVGALPAQGLIGKAATGNGTSVRTPVGSRNLPSQSIPPGVLAEVTAPGMEARSRVDLDIRPTGVDYRITEEWSVDGSYRGPHGQFVVGRHQTLMKIGVTGQTIAGRVRLTVDTALSTGTQAIGHIDIGDDGTIELVATPGPRQVFETPFTIGQQTLIVSTITGVFGQSREGGGPQGGRLDVRIEFLPPAICTEQRIAAGCEPGIELGATFDRDIVVRVDSALQATGAFLILGTLNLSVPIVPSLGCGFLGTDPAILVPGALVAGQAQFVLPTPRRRPISFRTQAVVPATEGAGLRIHMTDLLDVTCPRGGVR